MSEIMTDKYIKIKVIDLYGMVLALWEEYSEGENAGEDGILAVPLKLGLIERRTLTKADIESGKFEFSEFSDLSDLEAGDWYYHILSPDGIYKKLEAKDE